MFTFIYGGSASGKSEFAENLCISLNTEKMYYIATMKPFGEEAEERIKRHRLLRAEKQFETLEIYTGLKEAKLDNNSTVLLECMSNLAANEMFSENSSSKYAYREIMDGIRYLLEISENLIVVSNDVFSAGTNYGSETVEYMRLLGDINYSLAKMADEALEVVNSVPVYYKRRCR